MLLYFLVLLSMENIECSQHHNQHNNDDNNKDIDDKTFAATSASIKCDRTCLEQQQSNQQTSLLSQIKQLSILLDDNPALLQTLTQNTMFKDKKDKRRQKQIDCSQLPFKQSVQQRSKFSMTII